MGALIAPGLVPAERSLRILYDIQKPLGVNRDMALSVPDYRFVRAGKNSAFSDFSNSFA